MLNSEVRGNGDADSRDVSLHRFDLGDVLLESGATLPGAWLSYQTFGALAADGANAIVLPTHYTGNHSSSNYLVGPGMALDPERYFVVIPNLIGNGVSISPSNAPHLAPADFPFVSMLDNVLLQRRLLEAIGVRRIRAVVGFSMGGMQAYHWGAHCADMVERIAVICGAARASEHSRAFLSGLAAALTADKSWDGGRYTTQPHRGLRAMALACSAWPPSAHFYRQRLYRELGYASLDDFLENQWVATYQAMDANNLLCQIRTWRDADISRNARFNGDFEAALKAIAARVFVMPCSSDAYFVPEDSAIEVARMTNAELRIITSSWGHWAGSGRSAEALATIDGYLRELLAQ